MKLTTLFESIDFVPSYLDKEKGYNTTPYKNGERPCYACEGTAKNNPDDPKDDTPCYYCENTPGKEQYSEYDAPHMNVANQNAYLILQMIGLYSDDEDSSVGTIKNKDIPAIKRKLLILKNKDDQRNSYSRPDIT